MKFAIVFVALFGFIVSWKIEILHKLFFGHSLIKLCDFRLMHWHFLAQKLRHDFWVEADFWVEKVYMSHPIDQTIVDAQIVIQDTQTLAMRVHLLVLTVDQRVHVVANRPLLVVLLMVVLHHADALETHHATMMNKRWQNKLIRKFIYFHYLCWF